MTLRKISSLVADIPVEIDKIEFRDLVLPSAFKEQYADYVSQSQPGGYQNVEWHEYSARISTNTGKRIYLPSYWFHIAAKLSFLIDDLREHQRVFKEIFFLESEFLQTVADSLRLNDGSAADFRLKIDNFFSQKGRDNLEKAAFLEVVCDYKAWGGGKTIDRGDFVVSPLMKAAKLLAETQSGIAEIAEQLANMPSIRHSLINSIESLNPQIQKQQSKSSSTVKNVERLYLPKPFLLFAGLSGTGKSRFVRHQVSKEDSKTLCKVIAVRPDWHEPSDLLGYVSRIGDPKYIPTAFLIFLVSAWKSAFDSAVHSKVKLKPLDQIQTYWVCLDEMNLAPVEQYFADYLSVLETREWVGEEYSCDALLNPREFLAGELDVLESLKKSLGLDGHNELWSYFMDAGIPIPPNLVVAGTVNMDETTHSFSRKVIDRALTFDFGNFFPNDFEKYFGGQNEPKKLSFARYSKAEAADLEMLVIADKNGKLSMEFLNKVNIILKNTPFEVAFRALNELFISLLCFKPKDKIELLAIWDDFLMCKILPRLEGDEDKFRKKHKDKEDEYVLVKLLELAKATFIGESRPDLLNIGPSDTVPQIAFRSPQKLQWMKDRLDSGFTSFWP